MKIIPYKQHQLQQSENDGEVWVTRQQIADILGMPENSVAKLIKQALKTGRLQAYHEQRATVRKNNRDYVVMVYPIEVLLYIAIRSNAPGEPSFTDWFFQWLRDSNKSNRQQLEALQEKIIEMQQEARHLCYRNRELQEEADCLYLQKIMQEYPEEF